MQARTAASFREAASGLPAGIALRDERDDDLPFLRDLYASTREQELAPVPWSDQQKRAFLDSQFGLQRQQYRAHYAGAEWLVIERATAAIGRLYLWRGASDLRLMEIALLPAQRNAGIGTRIVEAVLDWADREQLAVSLHVEPFNPAYRLYTRLGFVHVHSTGVHHRLERPLRAASR